MVKVVQRFNSGELPDTDLPGYLEDKKGYLVKVKLDDDSFRRYLLKDGELVPLQGKRPATEFVLLGLLELGEMIFISHNGGLLCGKIVLLTRTTFAIEVDGKVSPEWNLNRAHSYDSLYNEQEKQDIRAATLHIGARAVKGVCSKRRDFQHEKPQEDMQANV